MIYRWKHQNWVMHVLGFVQGFGELADSIVTICSLGFYGSSFEMRCARYRAKLYFDLMKETRSKLTRVSPQAAHTAATGVTAASADAATPQLKLKHGKTYVDRNGDKVTVHLFAGDEHRYHYHYPFVDRATGETFSPRGAWQLGRPSGLDLVSLVEDPPVTNPSQGETK
jgi:hypothetical protein